MLLPFFCAGSALAGTAADAGAKILNAAALSSRERVLPFSVFQTDNNSLSWKATAWRGERVSGQLALRSESGSGELTLKAKPLLGPDGARVPLRVQRVQTTQAKGQAIPDVIGGGPDRQGLQAGSTETVWFSADVPQGVPAGIYRGEVLAAARGAAPVRCPMELRVLPAVLPPACAWSAHIDFWQYPEAVARWHKVPTWSAKHFSLMEPLMKRLAAAGQKAITCTLIDEAWNGQTYDKCPSMIGWERRADGRMKYDYKRFDQWVEFMTDVVGIRGQITCYTMLPWSSSIRVFDRRSGQYEKIAVKPGEPSYEAIWGDFLDDFRRHVAWKGWTERIHIGIDERPDAQVKALCEVLKKHAPEFKIASAVDKPTTTSALIDDLSIALQHSGSALDGTLEKRRAEGKKTSFYVCVYPPRPNTFTASDPAESEWLGIYAAAKGFDGVLRWAWNAWNENPFEKTDFGNWPAGDCFLVYPGNLTSIRFETLRDGIEEFEKIRLLREKAGKADAPEAWREAVGRMNAVLEELSGGVPSGEADYRTRVEKAREAVEKASEALAD